ncbi:hypothetical protein NQ317_010038 [Molorchus minor]|uniref:DNA-dependent protein kinase catalytic subunit CC3 domain-containing protein n=1 Tax=Molorchus minor TaxID=1323400 RepID=A0ABQ9J6M1_9CUCU|nr:hypothetical protein NQ317_010038 [Molorchus minor]
MLQKLTLQRVSYEVKEDNSQEVKSFNNSPREIQLEEVDFNDHECMATVCGVIQHIFDSDHSFD